MSKLPDSDLFKKSIRDNDHYFDEKCKRTVHTQLITTLKLPEIPSEIFIKTNSQSVQDAMPVKKVRAWDYRYLTYYILSLICFLLGLYLIMSAIGEN